MNLPSSLYVNVEQSGVKPVALDCESNSLFPVDTAR